jgi:hypothetical protein
MTPARMVIVQADDIGMCEATVSALPELLEGGLVTSLSLMAPCPSFDAAAEWCRRHPEMEAGLHITLNSEWESYRWRGLSIEEYLPRTLEGLKVLDASAAVAEARAQMERFRSTGLTCTHIDAHMFAMRHRFPAEYRSLAAEWQAPALDKPPFDHIAVAPNEGDPEDRVEVLKALFDGLPPGLSCVILHPAVDTPELRAIVPKWRYRVADLAAARDPSLRAHVESLGIHTIKWGRPPGLPFGSLEQNSKTPTSRPPQKQETD